MNATTRVLVIDLASPLRDTLVAFLESRQDVDVVGVGANGQDAVRLTQRLRPTVVTMGATSLSPSGVQTIRQIMRVAPTPIVVAADAAAWADIPDVSGDAQARMEMSNANAIGYAFAALQAGALTVVNAPEPAHPASYEALLDTVCLMAHVPVIHHWERKEPAEQPALAQPPTAARFSATQWAARMQQIDIIGIAASTGGPAALATLLRTLPANFAVPIVLVQHITHGFGAGLVKWLDTQTPLHVQLATATAQPEPGWVLVSPDNYHMQVNRLGKVALNQQTVYKGLRPSANYLFGSLAEAYGPRAMGIVLTGMGDDGADGLTQLHRSGGLTIAQDEASSVVYGMPQQVVQRQVVDKVLNLETIAKLLQTELPGS